MGIPQASQIANGLKRLQAWLVVLYAVSLPTSITLTGILFCACLVVSLAKLVCENTNKLQLPAQGVAGPAPTISIFPLAMPFAAFAAALVISGFANPGSTTGSLIDRLREGFFSLWSFRLLIIPFWAYYVFARDRKLCFTTVKGLLLIGALSGLWGAIQQLTGFHPFGYQYLQGTGFIGAPMAFAGQMQIFAMLALAFLVTGAYSKLNPRIKRGTVYGAITIANLLGLFFAAERSAWLGAIAGILSMTALVSRKFFVRGLIALIAFALVAWFFIPVVQTRIEPLVNWRKDTSTNVRLYIWKESLKLWQKSPVFGIGIRNYPHFDIPGAIVPGRSKSLTHAHSNYLHILSTTGLLGIAAFLWLQLATLHLGWRIYTFSASGESASPVDIGEKALGLGVFAFTIALMISGIFEYNFGTSQVLQAQWLVLGMLRKPENLK